MVIVDKLIKEANFAKEFNTKTFCFLRFIEVIEN